MAIEKGRAFAQKVFEAHELIVQNDSTMLGGCFDTNGKKEGALTRVQMSILLVVKMLGKTNISQMKRILSTSKSSLSITVNRLVKEGYLKKKQDMMDGRKVYFYLTKKGKMILEEMTEKVLSSIGKFYDSVEEKDQAILEMGIDCFNRIIKCQMEADNNEK